MSFEKLTSRVDVAWAQLYVVLEQRWNAVKDTYLDRVDALTTEEERRLLFAWWKRARADQKPPPDVAPIIARIRADTIAGPIERMAERIDVEMWQAWRVGCFAAMARAKQRRR